MARTIGIIGLGLVVAVAAGGCATRQVSVDNPVRITANEYDRMFESALDVLRNEMFTLDRQDRRFGVITTRPMWASSLLEPWRQDNTTFYQTADSTLNYQQRVVRITLTPRADELDPDAPARDYDLEVRVNLQRRQHPNRELNTAVVSTLGFNSRAGGARRLTTEQGEELSFWEPVGRDELLEQRLVNRILARATVIGARHETDDPEALPDDVPEIR